LELLQRAGTYSLDSPAVTAAAHAAVAAALEATAGAPRHSSPAGLFADYQLGCIQAAWLLTMDLYGLYCRLQA
jgi:hypothetical protein